MNTGKVQNLPQTGKFYTYLVSFVASVGGFLFGYDLNIIGAAMVFLKEQFNMDAGTLAFTTSSATLGCIFGPALALLLGNSQGRKRCLYLAAVLFFLHFRRSDLV